MDLALLLFAFSAGAAAFFAPCCVAMLPAYVAYAVRGSAPAETRSAPLGARILGITALAILILAFIPLALTSASTFTPLPDELLWALPQTDVSVAILLMGIGALIAALLWAGRARAAGRGAAFGLLATLGFLTIFLLVGLPIAFLARALAAYLPYLAILVGATLAILGVLMLAGKHLAPRLPVVTTDTTTRQGFVLFGVGYGLASLSCTFPIFLAVMAAGLLAGGFASGMAVFAAYATGKAILLVGITAASVAGGDATRAKLGRLAPTIARAAANLMIASGVYIAYYYGRAVILA